MKAFSLPTSVAAATLLLATCGFAADKTEKPVTFRTDGSRYVTSVANGGLNTSGAEITDRQTFVMVDLNGGELADGDAVQIKWAPAGTRPTYWRESENGVNRVGTKPDAACTFTIKLKGKTSEDSSRSVALQTASGKFVAVPGKGAVLSITDAPANAITLEVREVRPAGQSDTTTKTIATGVAATAAAATIAAVPVSPTPAGDEKPTLFLIGDSTVNNGTKGQMGWGSALGEYFDLTKINIVNRARGGRSSRSFFHEGLWNNVLAEIEPGDFVAMQFGHNDGGAIEGEYPRGGRASIKGNGEETQEVTRADGKKEVVHSYGWYLRKYAADAKAKGAAALVFSPIPRNRWTNGKVDRSTGWHSTWAEEAAQQAGATFIDLNAIIADQYDPLGKEKVDPLFFGDWTHTSPDGATFNARSVVSGIKAVKDHPLNTYLSPKAADITAYGAK